MSEIAPSLGEAAKQIATVDPKQVEQDLNSMKGELDLNKDGKISFKEFSIGLITVPRLLVLVVALITGMYGIYNMVLGAIGEGWNSIALVFSMSMVSSVIIIYSIIKKMNEAEIETISKIVETTDDAYQHIYGLAENYLKQLGATKDELQAIKTTLTCYKFVVDSIKQQHPEYKIPDISEP